MNYTDNQLKAALAKMMPKQTKLANFFWHVDERGCLTRQIEDTELLHLCWLVEEELIPNQYKEYEKHLYDYGDGNKTGYRWHATWQQRVIALAKVKGIEI